MNRTSGTYENLGDLASFIPFPLPPQNPPLDFNRDIIELYGQAMQQLGRLNEMTQRLPDSKRFIRAYVIKEAILSSAIEGIHTTLIDVFTKPVSEIKPNKETQLVLNYTKALDVALNMIQNQGLPIVNRVILGAHEALMNHGEGEKASPGQFRKQSVRVGSLIPPPAPKVPDLIAALERFINEDNSLPPLIKAGLAHVQFETIHPFLDGNGRIGRLLIVLMLIESGLLNAPILYPSYFFKKRHMEYYVHLDKVRLEGDFEGWIHFYLQAISLSAQDAWYRAKEIEKLESDLIVQVSQKFSKNKESAHKALSVLFQIPIISVSELSHRLKKSYNAVSQLIQQFVDLGILQERGEQKRNKLFLFISYLNLLDREYTPSQLGGEASLISE